MIQKCTFIFSPAPQLINIDYCACLKSSLLFSNLTKILRADIQEHSFFNFFSPVAIILETFYFVLLNY